MNCPKCNSLVNENDTYCSNCGASLTYNPQVQSKIKKYNINITYNATDMALEDTYIEVAIEKIRRGGFSLSAFCFGWLYALYRKMYLLGFIWYVITITINFLAPKYAILMLLLNLVFSAFFKQLYVKHVQKKVQKIKKANPNSSFEELSSICKLKGGTNTVALIFFITLYILLGVLNYYLSTGYKEVNYDELKLEIPKIFNKYEDQDRFENLKAYGLNKDQQCLVMLLKSSTELGINEYLYAETDDGDTFDNKRIETINGIAWNAIDITNKDKKEYRYVVTKNNHIYMADYVIYKDSNDVCSNGYKQMLETIDID